MVDTGIQTTESSLPSRPKDRADIRKRILITRDMVVQSAKNPVIDNKEFFSSRENQDGVGPTVQDSKIQALIKKKCETDRSRRLIQAL